MQEPSLPSSSLAHESSSDSSFAIEPSSDTGPGACLLRSDLVSMRKIYTAKPGAEGRTPVRRVLKEVKKRIYPIANKKYMEGMVMERTPSHEEHSINSYVDRSTLCLPSFQGTNVVQGSEGGYQDVVRRHFVAAESNATERLLQLKSRLREASTFDFWAILTEEMSEIFDAQSAFVAKRMVVDDPNSAVEMPEYGEPGSCLMALAFYLNNGRDVKTLHRDYQYAVYGTPCEHMKHDKVFIVPEKMMQVVPSNPNKFPWDQSEAFIGVPLFAEGKSFAHFGMIWSTEGAARRKLSWGFTEMFLHSLEDMICQRILEGKGFAKEPAPGQDLAIPKVIPLSAITASQSLKPYARSLSHELRTPMQGVVGMLDIMYATVVEAIAEQKSEENKAVFQDLKSHIEVVQDSSKRAVEAADNVVHAYDLNMQMPDAPLTPEEIDSRRPSSNLEVPGQDSHSLLELGTRSPSGVKRSLSPDVAYHDGPPLKKMFAVKEADAFRIYCSDESASCDALLSNSNANDRAGSKSPSPAPSTVLNPLHRRVITRDFFRTLLSDTLRSGHPIEKLHLETELGERINVKTIGSRGEIQERIIHLEVDVDVPETIITEQQHLQFSLQKVIDNALKFTESGSITIKVRLGKNDEKIEVCIMDTGCGIDEESQQNLFKPHFQQDSSISRARDGLGLSLFNAKAHLRKNLGGDVTLERSETEGPSRGSEFLIRLPILTFDPQSREAVVGTPPTSSHSTTRPSWGEFQLSPHLRPKSPLPALISPAMTEHEQSDSSFRKSIPTAQPASTRKKATFNPHLAKDYPLSILIAEDNVINRNVAIGSLAKLGYNKSDITVAFDGLEAIKYYEASLELPTTKRFDVILMDIWMPNMDGYEATRNIKELAKSVGETITTIAVTADITSESVERAKAVGMEGFLAKPYKVKDFERLIKEHFSKRDDL